MDTFKKFLSRFGFLALGLLLGLIGFSLMLALALLHFNRGDPRYLIIWLFGVLLLAVAIYKPVRSLFTSRKHYE